MGCAFPCYSRRFPLLHLFFPFRKARYIGYAVLLVAAFFWPPFWFFFHSCRFPDSILRLGSKIHPRRIFLESASIEKKAFFLCVVGYCPLPFCTGVQAMDRGRSGPWTGVVVGKVASIYRTKTALYLLKDRELFESGHPGRELILSNRSVPPPLSGRSAGIERRLGLRKRISFMSWSTTPQGARLDPCIYPVLLSPDLDKQREQHFSQQNNYKYKKGRFKGDSLRFIPAKNPGPYSAVPPVWTESIYHKRPLCHCGTF